jgi:hypothetical protein
MATISSLSSSFPDTTAGVRHANAAELPPAGPDWKPF